MSKVQQQRPGASVGEEYTDLQDKRKREGFRRGKSKNAGKFQRRKKLEPLTGPERKEEERYQVGKPSLRK